MEFSDDLSEHTSNWSNKNAWKCNKKFGPLFKLDII